MIRSKMPLIVTNQGHFAFLPELKANYGLRVLSFTSFISFIFSDIKTPAINMAPNKKAYCPCSIPHQPVATAIMMPRLYSTFSANFLPILIYANGWVNFCLPGQYTAFKVIQVGIALCF